jgi:hypothetical protein
LAVVFMTFLNPNGFISAGNSRKGCTHLSNKDHLSLSLRDLKPDITRESLCLAMRPASICNFNFYLLSFGIPPWSIPVTIIMSFGHFVDVLAFFATDPSYCSSSSLVLRSSASSFDSEPSSLECDHSLNEAWELTTKRLDNHHNIKKFQ